MKINKIELSNINQYAELCDELFGSKTNLLELEKALKKIVANEDYILVGIKNEKDELIGSVMGILCQDTVGECKPFVVLENLIVSTKYRKMGIGKQLITFIEDWARENNSYFVMFMSLAKRKEAHAFYESLGYSQEISNGFKKYL